ncbi:AI-2E family transporter [Olsenella uli]|uniref:AI-2E family transporter n=1 Tax=Olsenella uli TaxID=133926 RepID=UPI0019562853|nr:AI-2E family transporter [Olsenella uli]MBM6817129.1 AI-2E family transporter [Olsenella uli]
MDQRAARVRLACLRVWTVVGAILVAAVALMVLGRLSSVLLFLATGCLIAYVASPLVNWLARHRVPRGIASILGVIVVALAVVLLFSLIIPLFFAQMTDLLRDLPARISEMGSWLAELERQHDILKQIGEYVDTSSLVSSLQSILSGLVSALLGAISNGLVPAVSNIASAVFTVFLGLVFAFWLVCDYPRINDEICLVLGPRRSENYRVTLAVVSRSVGGYLRSTLIDSIIQGSLACVGFMLAGHPYAGLMGVLSGVLNFVPVVGPSISAIVATGVALFYSPAMAFWTMVAAMVAQNVTDNLIVPRINQSTMQIHPVLSLLAIMIGSAVMGPLGMVVAIPLCAIAKGLFVFYFETRTGEQVVSYDGALFKGTPFHDASGNPVPASDALGEERFAESEIMPAPREGADATAAPRPKRPIERLVERLRSGEKDEG